VTRAMQPILSTYDPEQDFAWVDATPFRAHVGQLLATGLTEPVIARLTGLSVRAVAHLAHGRSGRPIRRISGDSARRLLRITTLEAKSLRYRPVSVRASRSRLRAMAESGWSVERLADDIGICIPDVQQILGPGTATCSQLTALKIAAAFQQWEDAQDFPGLHAVA
jgi:hypothetical protein